MKIRIITGLILALVLIPLLFVSANVFYVVLGLITLYAAYEIMRVFRHKHDYSIAWSAYHIIGTGLIYGVFITYYLGEITSLFIILMLFLLLVVSLVWFVFDDRLNTDMLSKSWLGMFYVAFGFLAISMVRSLGIDLLIYLLILTMATDMFAYFSGYLFGKHKLAPLISPKKTIEGAIGGTLIAVLIATMYVVFSTLFSDVSIGIVVVTGIIVSFLAQIGDLVASKIKRAHDVKDFSKLLPGHGGVLDRFDSSIFAAMALMLVIMILEVF